LYKDLCVDVKVFKFTDDLSRVAPTEFKIDF